MMIVMKTRILAVANQKGGVGKTTTCVNLAAALVEQGRKVLLIDNDPQANLTSYLTRLDRKGGAEKATIDELYLTKKSPTKEIARDRFVRSYTIGFDYIASESALSGVEFYLYTRNDRELILLQNLAWAQEHYDFILIDNPPSVNLLTLNALCFAQEVLIPLQTEFFSLEGIAKIQETIAMVKARWNPLLRIAGLLPTQVDSRKRLTTEVLTSLQENFSDALLKTRIRDNAKVSESSGHGQTVLRYAPTSTGAEDYRSLADEILNRI